MRRLKRKGFTLVEIMIVVAIIGLLAAIAIPNFVTARATAQANTCRANLRTLQGALELAVFDGVTAGGALTNAELRTALVNYIRTFPDCPTTPAVDEYTAAGGIITCANGHTI